MRIGMVLAEGSLPTDVRVTREARALLAAAHRIFILCRQNPGQPLKESWHGIEIERVKTLRDNPSQRLRNSFSTCFYVTCGGRPTSTISPIVKQDRDRAWFGVSKLSLWST